LLHVSQDSTTPVDEMEMMVWVLVLGGVGVAGYGIHRLLRWAESRGYVYYLDEAHRRPPPLGLLEEIYEPSMEHVIDEEASAFVRAEEDESGSG
jgi:hypothetical protein